MTLPLFSHFFSKTNTDQKFLDSTLLKQIKKTVETNNLYLYENIDIFHHKQRHKVPLILIDPKRGIYIFEYKTWSYDELKDAKIIKASNQTSADNTLAFDSIHQYIHKRFREVANYDDINIFHFAIMENLSKDEYELLNNTVKTLLPSKRIIFNSCEQEEITSLLEAVCDVQEDILDTNKLISTLFIQMLVIKDDGTIALTSQEQDKIINDSSNGVTYISCKDGSGKSTTILLKAIFTHLKSPKLNITIVEPTLLASGLLKKKLLDIAEYSMIEIDFSKINIITPHDIKKSRSDLMLIDDFDVIGVVDINLEDTKHDIFIFEKYNPKHHYAHTLKENYIGQCKVNVINHDLYLSAFLKIAEILNSGASPSDIMIVSVNDEINRKILEDLPNFVDDIPVLLDKKKNLHAQTLEHIIVTKFDALYGLSRDFVIALNPVNVEDRVVNFIYSRARKQIYVIYDKQNPKHKTTKEE